MLHPLFSTIVQRPDLVVDHLSAYAALIQEEANEVGTELLIRTVAWVMAVLSAVIFLVLTGTAVMLGFINNRFHWTLVAVPTVALLLTILAAVIAKKPMESKRFPELKAQIHSDARALRNAA